MHAAPGPRQTWELFAGSDAMLGQEVAMLPSSLRLNLSDSIKRVCTKSRVAYRGATGFISNYSIEGYILQKCYLLQIIFCVIRVVHLFIVHVHINNTCRITNVYNSTI